MKKENSTTGFTRSITFKAVAIGFLIILFIIPQVMLQGLVSERQQRSRETIAKINAKWSDAQTITPPILCVPCLVPVETDAQGNVKKYRDKEVVLHVMPQTADISTKLFSEERRYNIFRTIVYKSTSRIEGTFGPVDMNDHGNWLPLWDKAFIKMDISDMRGLTDDIKLELGNNVYTLDAAGSLASGTSQSVAAEINDAEMLISGKTMEFSCTLNLKGSVDIDYVPLARTTKVQIEGEWTAPSFTGNFSPDYTLGDNGFTAEWSILGFNRNIPFKWIELDRYTLDSATFGVSLIDPVDHYQQNMRSVKYSLMFIVLTFGLFFIVEITSRKRIHPVQYALVGLALVIFYALLLSFSERISFGLSYLIASVAVVTLITSYAYSMFKNRMQTAIVTLMLVLLYGFLYVILQLEDIALLIGSISLFAILALVMYFLRKVNWYGTDANTEADSDVNANDEGRISE